MEKFDDKILKNYDLIKKLEEVIPLKKAELELKLWEKIKQILNKKISGIDFSKNDKNDDENKIIKNLSYSGEVSILETKWFEHKNLESIHFGIGKNNSKDYFYLYLIPRDSNHRDYPEFYNFYKELKKNKKNFHWNQAKYNVYKIFPKNSELFKDKENDKILFSFSNESFYNILDEKKLGIIAQKISDIIYEEISKFQEFKNRYN